MSASTVNVLATKKTNMSSGISTAAARGLQPATIAVGRVEGLANRRRNVDAADLEQSLPCASGFAAKSCGSATDSSIRGEGLVSLMPTTTDEADGCRAEGGGLYGQGGAGAPACWVALNARLDKRWSPVPDAVQMQQTLRPGRRDR